MKITNKEINDYLSSWSEGIEQPRQELGEVVIMKIAETYDEKPRFIIDLSPYKGVNIINPNFGNDRTPT